MNHALLEWMAAHPWLALALSFPTAFVIVSVAWCITSMLTTTMSNMVTLLTGIGSVVVTLVRGYPPARLLDDDQNYKDNDSSAGV